LRSAIEKDRANTGQAAMMAKLAIDECDGTALLEQ
jgi:hypothetical protein